MDEFLLGGREIAAPAGEQEVERAGGDGDGLQDLLVDFGVLLEELLAGEVEADAAAARGGFDAGDRLPVGLDLSGKPVDLLPDFDRGGLEVVEDAFDRREDLPLLDLRRKGAGVLEKSRSGAQQIRHLPGVLAAAALRRVLRAGFVG